MTVSRFLDIHLLQTIPFANLNRDDLGAPKTVVYGGATRTRVSSQCWKRQVRLEVETALGDPAVRTRRIMTAVAERLVAQGWPADLAAFAGRQVLLSAGKSGIKVEKDRDKNDISSVLLYLPETGLDELAALAVGHHAALEAEAKKKTKDQKAVLPTAAVVEVLSSRTGTINLFGRMLAELPGAEVDGAVQVAHAFTTHTTEPEIDFFTAVDDIRSGDDHGSGHMNAGEFSAGVFYRYACLDLTGLVANLGGDTATARELTAQFCAAFLSALPTGKRTATAPNTLPDLACVAVRSDRPVSLAGAFEAPVRAAAEGGYAAESRRVLAQYAENLHELWGDDGRLLHGHAVIDGKYDGLGGRSTSFRTLFASAVDAAYPGTPS
jgi:CRISPR system Cascade subunit CasC